MTKIFSIPLFILAIIKSTWAGVTFSIIDPKIPDLTSRNYPMTLANYGFIPYGRNLVGNLHLAHASDSCTPVNSVGYESSSILLIERGNCTFVTKTHYAELAGAKMAIIIDSLEENEDRIIMVDDGFGSNIHIPTVMLEKEAGDHLINYLNSTASASITVSIGFETVECNLMKATSERKS